MSKFKIVDQEPEELGEGEYVIKMPDFTEEIKESEKYASRLGGQKITTPNHLKSIADNIGSKYDPEGFNPVSSIPYALYEGLPYEDYKELSQHVLRMFNNHHPKIVERYLEYQIKNRPENIKFIYFVGDEDHVKPFINNGLDRVYDESEEVKKTVKKDETDET